MTWINVVDDLPNTCGRKLAVVEGPYYEHVAIVHYLGGGNFEVKSDEVVRKWQEVPEINQKTNNSSFHDNLGGRYKIHVGWLRYSGGNAQSWIAAAIDNDNGASLDSAFDDLDAGDMDASCAIDFIVNNAKLFEYGDSASSAVAALEKSIQDKINDKD